MTYTLDLRGASRLAASRGWFHPEIYAASGRLKRTTWNKLG